MEFFYAAESIRLARACPGVAPGDPWWSSPLPETHIGQARGQSRASVAGMLLAKYSRLPSRTARADTARVLAGWYCGAAGPDDDLRSAVAEVFHWTSLDVDPRGTGPLRLWFTAESVQLAVRGGYANPARNVAEPRLHRDWSTSEPVQSVIRDLAHKSCEQFQRAVSASEDEAVQYGAEVAARYASWGGQPPDGRIRPAVPGQWQDACRYWFRDDPWTLWRHLDGMLRDTAWRLLSHGRNLGGSSHPASRAKC
jgi:hypothetical protein